MPIPFLVNVFFNGLPSWMPDPWLLLQASGTLAILAATKTYTSGATTKADRNMHGRVVMITGGTSGVGAVVATELARRGAQLVLLTRVAANDPFLVDYIDDLRERTGNRLIYAEQVDLASLHSIRQFATRWVDNAPPRRLDMVVLCAATLTPPGGARTETAGGVESTWMVNYLANFHLLGILSPAIRAQPFDRDVRVVLPTCPSYIGSPPLLDMDTDTDTAVDAKDWTPWRAYARSKLALVVFGRAFQKHLDAYKRPDQLPVNARVVFADPGFARTPGMRRWLTRGSVLGLVAYLLCWFFAWLLLKSPYMAAQSVLHAVLEGSIAAQPGGGGKLIKECMEVDFARRDIDDEDVARRLWESSDRLIERVEKEQAVERARAKKLQKEMEKQAEEDEKVKEIESLVDTIKKGKKKEVEKKTKSTGGSSTNNKQKKKGGAKSS